MRVPRPLHIANEGLAFLLELVALGLLAWWGATRDTGTLGAVALAVACPLLAAVLWGLFAAPRARVRLPLPGVLAVKALVFGTATAAYWALGHPAPAVAFAVVVVLNVALAEAGRQAAFTA